jgi:hypothetical protein
MHDYGLWGTGADRCLRLPARKARLGRRAAAIGRVGAGRAVQRNRGRGRDDRAPRARGSPR